MALFGVGLAFASDADAMVGEVVMHFGQVDFRHVAGRAVFRGHGAGFGDGFRVLRGAIGVG